MLGSPKLSYRGGAEGCLGGGGGGSRRSGGGRRGRGGGVKET